MNRMHSVFEKLTLMADIIAFAMISARSASKSSMTSLSDLLQECKVFAKHAACNGYSQNSIYRGREFV